MARGRGRGHKGQRRHFTNPDDLEAKRDRIEKEKNWRQSRGDVSDDDTDDDEEKEKKGSGSGSDSSHSDDDSDSDAKAKGVEGLIEIENPNRVIKKAVKIDKLDVTASSSRDESQLSRREREELEKQRARENYARLHAQGKTDQARADLARLALIKQQREEAAKKKEDERKLKEQELKAKQAQTNKALGKK